MEEKQKLWKMKYHLMPPKGWLNDPNGLYQKDGVYHVFFQYAPDYPASEKKHWGQYASCDLLNWDFTGIALSPDAPFDRDGAYSGCALTDGDETYIFYSGNVKEDGDYDYIYEGRRADTIMGVCRDGKTIAGKRVVIDTDAYPAHYSCHIRDPKVWREADGYYMVLGGRTMEDEGRVLLYHSMNLENWTFVKEFSKEEPFGYMWECPDLFHMNGRWILSCCPQGVTRGQYRCQNIHQSGYFPVFGDFRTDCKLGDFEQWDYGFDFYAPQTFVDEKGRRIMIGWMGLPDLEEEYENPTLAGGWMHALTMAREITCKDDKICQNPVEEYRKLRKNERAAVVEGHLEWITNLSIEAEILLDSEEDLRIEIDPGFTMSYNCCKKEFSLEFAEQAGAGRRSRTLHLEKCRRVQMYVDRSCVEIYLNHGEKVLTSRFYPDSPKVDFRVLAAKCRVKMWDL